jgi:hypothetical protein
VAATDDDRVVSVHVRPSSVPGCRAAAARHERLPAGNGDPR